MPDRPKSSAPPDLAAWSTDDDEIVVLAFAAPERGGAALTEAERDVLEQLLAGRSNAQIAARRRTSPRTVANQVASLFRKLGVRSRLELAARGPLLGGSD